MPNSNKNSKKHNSHKKAYIIVISILLVAALVFASWYLYNQSRSAQQDNAASTTDNKPIDGNASTPDKNQTEDIKDVGTIFKIPELGIQFVLPEGLEGLEYEMVDLPDGGKSAGFTTAEIRSSKDATEYCLASKGALGGLVKFTYDPTNRSDENTAFQLSLFKIGSNYFSYQLPPQSCSLDENIGQKQLDLSRKLSASLRNAEVY